MTDSLPTPQLDILVDSPAYFRIGLLGNVVVVSWRGPIDVAAVAQFGQVAHDLKERAGPVRHSYIHLMTERVQLPDSSARNEVGKLLPSLTEHVGVVVVVLDGSGFWVSALRGFVTGVRVLAPRNFDIRAESSLENMLSWFPAEHLKRTGVNISREQLDQLVLEAKTWQK
jgi:hypothetical protein